MSQIEIAHELQVSKQLISADVQYLRSQAKESIKEYVTEHLPEQYEVCLSALDTILKHAFDILETADDNREKLQAMSNIRRSSNNIWGQLNCDYTLTVVLYVP
jgi:hypothetical protein